MCLLTATAVPACYFTLYSVSARLEVQPLNPLPSQDVTSLEDLSWLLPKLGMMWSCTSFSTCSAKLKQINIKVNRQHVLCNIYYCYYINEFRYLKSSLLNRIFIHQSIQKIYKVHLFVFFFFQLPLKLMKTKTRKSIVLFIKRGWNNFRDQETNN